MKTIATVKTTAATPPIRFDLVLWAAWFGAMTIFGADLMGSPKGELRHYIGGAFGGFLIAFCPVYLVWLWRIDQVFTRRLVMVCLLGLVLMLAMHFTLPAHFSDLLAAR